ncbi:Transposon Ty3-I Gag-Pol polyprotein [Vitis vinifera]|uniref:Transposon Ty3-I Gag-Pol polyprotein n=1 Tax=Vitis vinifera TaxID=29760 RepID=A0A438E7A8_VITVI|nr:Transposon Ty3-I Gag-Pol polyprotein [Vitis vinifera]
MMGLRGLLWVLKIQSSFNLLLDRPWIHEASAIPSSLYQKISHSDDDLHLTGFIFDEVPVVSLEDDSRDVVSMSFDRYSSTLVLSMMRNISYLPGLGLGRRQVRARLSGIPFDYPLRPYTFRLADYFIRGSKHVPRGEGINHISKIVEIQDIQQALGQMHFSYGITKGSDAMIVAPSSPRQANMFSICFPDEDFEYGLFVDSRSGPNGVTLDDAYIDEMDMIGIGHILDTTPHRPHSAFDMFSVSMLEIDGNDSITDVATYGFISVERVSNPVDPPLSLTLCPERKVTPVSGSTKSVDFRTSDQPRELKIGSSLSLNEISRLIDLLRSYLDVKEEIQKQHSVGFLSVVEYLEWLANVVPVPKKNSKVRVCVDYRDLNKASPKNDFPLPHIYMLVDSIAGHSMLSFMDRFSGYNQILMALEDMEKTYVITEWGTYCYKVMPFGLKNAGATYQRAYYYFIP